MASLAVFLVLGGATAWAALGKNTVGSKQLKKNAVTTAKIKNNAVTTGKIKNGAITGAKVNVGTLGKVPSASTADTATSAGNANNANTVGGNTVKKFFYRSNATATVQPILSLNGLTLSASCPGGTPNGIATTSVGESLIRSGGTFLGNEPFYAENDVFQTGVEFDFLASAVTFADSIQGTLTYAQPGGAVVTAVFAAEEGSLGVNCVITGFATG
jgi:hypothetical protein